MQERREGGEKTSIGYDPSVVSKEPKISKKNTRQRNTILRITVLVIILIVSFSILISPGLSPISSVRDTDGDGVADSFDKQWLNSSTWNQAFAKIVVSVTNMDHVHNMSFSLYLDGISKTGWSIQPLHSIIYILPVSWYYGDNSTKAYAVTIIFSSLDPIDRNDPPIDSRTILVSPNESVAVPSFY